MKINYRNYPILQRLQEGFLGELPIYEADFPSLSLIINRYVSDWKSSRKAFQSEIDIVSDPFWKACEKSSQSLLEFYYHLIQDNVCDMDITGTYILGDFIFMIDYHIKKDSQDQEMVFFIFSKKGAPLGYHISACNGQFYWASQIWELNSQEAVMKWILMQFSKIICIKMFKSYAQVETTILQPKQKTREILCRYQNNTNLSLTFLDSKWFINLITSEGFNVRGHFRFQPKKKDGEWTRELIWISEFQKTGYTSAAKILSHQEQKQN